MKAWAKVGFTVMRTQNTELILALLITVSFFTQTTANLLLLTLVYRLQNKYKPRPAKNEKKGPVWNVGESRSGGGRGKQGPGEPGSTGSESSGTLRPPFAWDRAGYPVL